MSSIEDLRDEMARLLREHVEDLNEEVFTGRMTKEEYAERATRLNRIREVSADYLAELRRRMIS